MIFNDLYNKILTKYYEPGDILPTELEMEKIYGTSRAPIRQALAKLEMEGLIYRKAGKGTFVAQHEVSGPWVPMGGFGSEFSKKGSQIRHQTLLVEKIIPDKDITHFLSLSNSDEVVHIARIRYVDEIPIFYLHHYIPNLDIDKISGLGNIGSMRTFIREKCGFNICYESEELAAIKADEHVSDMLKVETGYPINEIVRISYNEEFKPMVFARYYVRTEVWKYRVMFSKDNNGFPF